MAVTQHDVPSQYFNLSGNPVVYTFSSDQTGQPNFSYYIEVYINGTLYKTAEVFQESGIYGKYDMSEDLEAYIPAPTLPTDDSGVDAGTYSFYIDVYEKYGTTATLQANTAMSTRYAIKGKKFIDEWIYLDTDDYYIDDNTYTKKFLTECPTFNLREGESQFLSFYLQDASSYGYNLDYYYYDSSGSSLHNETVSNTGYDFHNAVLLDWDTINGYYSLDGISYIEVFVNIPIDSYYSEKIRIDIDTECKEYTQRLHFLNQLGGMDSFTFTQVGRKNMTTETKQFNTILGSFNGSSFGFDGLNSQVNNYQVTGSREITIESGWLTEAEQTWLYDNLFTSPFVLMETSNGLKRVANMSTSVKYNKTRTDKNFNTTIKINDLKHSSMIV